MSNLIDWLNRFSLKRDVSVVKTLKQEHVRNYAHPPEPDQDLEYIYHLLEIQSWNSFQWTSLNHTTVPYIPGPNPNKSPLEKKKQIKRRMDLIQAYQGFVDHIYPCLEDKDWLKKMEQHDDTIFRWISIKEPSRNLVIGEDGIIGYIRQTVPSPQFRDWRRHELQELSEIDCSIKIEQLIGKMQQIYPSVSLQKINGMDFLTTDDHQLAGDIVQTWLDFGMAITVQGVLFLPYTVFSEANLELGKLINILKVIHRELKNKHTVRLMPRTNFYQSLFQKENWKMLESYQIIKRLQTRSWIEVVGEIEVEKPKDNTLFPNYEFIEDLERVTTSINKTLKERGVKDKLFRIVLPVAVPRHRLDIMEVVDLTKGE